MLLLSGIVLSLASLILAVATVVLLIEIAAATGQQRAGAAPESGPRPNTTILVPAHNEEQGLAATLEGLKSQLGAGDRILVIADNCTDDTAAVARANGVDTIERHDPDHRGKGYALQFGLDHVADRPPDVVTVMDADCRAAPGAIDALARAAASFGRPVQAIYLMTPGSEASLGEKLSAFAFAVKNHARPAGLRRLGLPCPLTGTGMAFPWAIIREARLATGDIVEDMRLGIDLAIAGHPPTLALDARVTSDFPSGEESQTGQRRRWEHGHLATISAEVPRLIAEGIARARPSLLAAALDVMIPPLSLLAFGLVATFLLSAILAALGGTTLPLGISAAAIALAALSLVMAWQGYGRTIISGAELMSAPLYAARKLPVYIDFIRRRERQWVRTPRGNEDARH